MAQVARFYGFAFSEMMSMESWIFYDFIKSMTSIQAQESLIGMQVGDFSNVMKSQSRRNFHKKVHRLAHPSLYDNQQGSADASTKDFQAQLRKMGL